MPFSFSPPTTHIMEMWIGLQFLLNVQHPLSSAQPCSCSSGYLLPAVKGCVLRGFPGGEWLRIRLPMQETWVRALVQEDPTCRGATKPMCHNYWACALEPTCLNYWAHEPQLEKAHMQQRRPNTTKNKYKIINKFFLKKGLCARDLPLGSPCSALLCLSVPRPTPKVLIPTTLY